MRREFITRYLIVNTGEISLRAYVQVEDTVYWE